MARGLTKIRYPEGSAMRLVYKCPTITGNRQRDINVMSSASESFQSGRSSSGARAYARLDTRAAPPRRNDDHAVEPRVTTGEPEAVTLNRIGEFLELDFGRMFVWLRAGFAAMMVLAIAGAALGAAYAMLTKPQYTVSSEILIDPAKLQVVPDDLFAQPGQVDGQLLNAGSKLRVLTSGNVLARVVATLDLANDPEFVEPEPLFSLSGLLGGSSGPSLMTPELIALAALEKRVTTRADQTSFVVTMGVTTESSQKSIRISNAIVDAFREELAQAEADGASRTAVALNERLEELRLGVNAAEDRVEAYKRERGLQSSAGELVSTQSMTQLNAQVIAAQTRVIEAEAAYNELVAGGFDATAGDSQQSATLSSLRAQYAQLKQQLDAESMIYGPRYPTITRLRTQLQAVQAELAAETARIVNVGKVRLDEARAALAALTVEADAARSSVFSDNEAMVQLRELERDASSKAAIYESFLARARQVTEQEQLDTTNIRLISTAVPPPARSWPPRTVVVMAAGAVAGLLLGLVLAIGMGVRRDMRRASAPAVAAAVA